MTPIKQRHKHWCCLACLESASIDAGSHKTQEQIDGGFKQFYPEPDRVFVSCLIPLVSFNIGLGNCFHLDKTKDFLLRYSPYLDKGVFIFIATQRNKGGGQWGHCWRVSKADENSLEVLEPTPGEKDFVPLNWKDLDTYDCLIYVVGRDDVLNHMAKNQI